MSSRDAYWPKTPAEYRQRTPWPMPWQTCYGKTTYPRCWYGRDPRTPSFWYGDDQKITPDEKEELQMKLSWPSGDTINSGLRHIYTATGTTVAIFLLLGLSGSDGTTITNAVHKIGDGVASIAAGISMLIPVVSGIYAMLSTTLKSRLTAISKSPEVKQIVVSTAAVADSVPSDKVTKG